MPYTNACPDSVFEITQTDLDILRTEGVRELQRTVRNTGNMPGVLKTPEFAVLMLPSSFSTLTYCTSGWGQECVTKQVTLDTAFSFENTKGRSSGESTPFFTVSSPEVSVDFAVCTSGNYRVSLTPCGTGIRVTVCEPNPSFAVSLQPGEFFCYPSLLVHSYTNQRQSYREKHRYQQEHLLSNPFFEELPVIYNHWWAYIDRYINEETILENARIARDIGAEMLVLDSGWYGKDDASEDSFLSRGDWDRTNKARFPHGIPELKRKIEDMGLKFGIWCEIEAIGENSELLAAHPEYVAKRDGKSMGYLCFGDKAVQEWAYQTMKQILTECGSTYWKLDFNLDPGFGCNCDYHDHGSGDGLYRHYEGLYRVMDRLREDFPNLVIENCSSGGQRLNLEMGKHTHVHFLSDPDYSTHQMRIFKVISRWLMPKQMLHFMWSNTVEENGSAPFPNLDLDTLTPEELRYHMRLAMMHPFGISHRLKDYSKRTLNLMKQQLELYKSIIRPYIACGEFLPVYQSDHTNFFSFAKDGSILIFGFAEEPDRVTLDMSEIAAGIPGGEWTLTDLDTGECVCLSKTEGLRYEFFSDCPWGNCLLLLQPNQ